MDKVEDSWTSVKNWFAKTTVTYLQDEQVKQPFGNYTSASNHTLTSTISLDTTLVGANFVTVAMDLSSRNATHWANGTYSLVYFQIEEPVPEETTGARLLQANATTTATTTAAPVTGTGNFEGWLGLLAGPGTVSGPVKLAANKQLWGTTNMNAVNDWFSTFGQGKGATATVDADPWQAADAKLQTFTAGNETHPGVWHAQAWRLASAVDTLRFKFETNKEYYGHVGHKYWGPATIKANDKTKSPTSSGFSEHIMFSFDGAATTVLGLSVLATTLAFF